MTEEANEPGESEEKSEEAAPVSTEPPTWPKGTEVDEKGRAVIRLIGRVVQKVNGTVVEDLKELRLAEPLMHHLAAQDGALGQIEASMRIVAACAGIPVSSVRKMSPVDFTACQNAIYPFVRPMMA